TPAHSHHGVRPRETSATRRGIGTSMGQARLHSSHRVHAGASTRLARSIEREGPTTKVQAYSHALVDVWRSTGQARVHRPQPMHVMKEAYASRVSAGSGTYPSGSTVSRKRRTSCPRRSNRNGSRAQWSAKCHARSSQATARRT